MVKNPKCYNLVLGGERLSTSGMITAKDSQGNISLVYSDDKRWLDGTLVGVTKGFVNCFDTYTSTYVQVPLFEFYNNVRYVGNTAYKVLCRLKGSDSKFSLIPKEKYFQNINNYETPSTNNVVCKDSQGNILVVKKDDSNYLLKKLVPIWTGKCHSAETKAKMRKVHQQNNHQKGIKNSQYGTCWVTKNGINKKIKKELLPQFIEDGWLKGRKIKKES